MNRKIRAAIATIPEDAWTPVTYPRAVWDEDQNRPISDAEIAEVPYTAFTAKKSKAVTADRPPRPRPQPQPPPARTSCSPPGRSKHHQDHYHLAGTLKHPRIHTVDRG
jgi:hypothetical protein